MKYKSSVNIIPKHKRGLWSPDEDQKLRDYILNHGLGCWSSVPINAGLQRNGKSCRLRWTNYLRPGLKRGMFTPHEEQIILTLHGKLGNKWSEMSRHLPGRSDNEIKNHWHSYLKKKYEKLEKIKLPSMSSDKSNEESPSISSFKSVSSCLESSRNMEKLSVGLKIPPKVLFADWISLDRFNLFDNSDELSVSGDALYPASSSQETTINGGSRVSNLPLSPELIVGSELYDLIFEENISLNFNINGAILCSWDDDLYSASTSSQSTFRSS